SLAPQYGCMPADARVGVAIGLGIAIGIEIGIEIGIAPIGTLKWLRIESRGNPLAFIPAIIFISAVSDRDSHYWSVKNPPYLLCENNSDIFTFRPGVPPSRHSLTAGPSLKRLLHSPIYGVFVVLIGVCLFRRA